MQDKINVNMGELKVVHNPVILQSIGLGSCIAICLYDKTKNIGGLAHIMSASSARCDVPLRQAIKNQSLTRYQKAVLCIAAG